ncbi:DUF1802 family protein [Bremerella sp. JC770]|uniref:DUF1802 family protein n=1 Tax=Bremerella sp. JC770 TaxID=3232137 RepID=UPI0034592781
MACQLALKEWNVVCEAIARGKQIVLARKGGISEPEGEFELPKNRFWLFPTHFHEAESKLNAMGRKLLEDHPEFTQPPASPDVTMHLVCEVTDAVYLEDESKIDASLFEQILNREALHMRYNYRAPGIHLLVIRAYEVSQPQTITPTQAMSGCKSWVELPTPLELGEMQGVIADADFEMRKNLLLSALRA